MRVLIDTNILLDFLTKRDPFFASAQAIIHLCDRGDIEGYIAAHSVLNAFFILRHQYTVEQRRGILKDICLLLKVVSVDGHNLLDALGNEGFRDFEDCVQMNCAVKCHADFILTRDKHDYQNSRVPAIQPIEFLHITQKGGS